MEEKEIIKIVQEERTLKKDDYFGSGVFYYLAGRFPDLTVSQCADIVDQIRKGSGLL